MRCFLSINIPQEHGDKINDFKTNAMDADFLKANFVKSNDFHINLKFLGDVDEEKIKEIKKILSQIKINPFEISLKSLGGFPTNNYVKVLWIGVDKGLGTLVKLQRDLDDALAKIGFQKDKNFVPHITLARIKVVYDKSALTSLFFDNETKEFGSFWCDKINFMSSELTTEGPIYQELSLTPQD